MRVLLSCFLMLITPVVLGGNLPRIIDPGAGADRPYLPDFSYAGYRNGLVPVPAATGRVIDVAGHGAKPDDGVDDSAAVLAAIAAANEVKGPVRVRFAAGRYRITEIIRIGRGDIVLQGAGSGAGGTVLEFPLPLAQVDSGTSFEEIRKYLREHDKRQVQPELNIDSYFSEYSWTGGFIWIQKPGTHAASYLPEYDPPIRVLADVAAGKRGERTLRLKSNASLKKDDVVQLQWTNSFGPDAKLIDAMYDDPDIEVGSHHWSFPDRPLVRQSTRIVAVDGMQLTIADPLLHDINDEIPAAIAEWDHIENVGIEDLHFEFPAAPYFGHHMERGYNGIYLTSAFDSWVRNVRFTNADAGILSYNSANVTLQDITSDGSRVAHYGVHMGNVHNVLAERVIVSSPVYHSLTFNTQSTKCVYKDALVLNSAVLDQHAGSNHQNLYDNVTLHIKAQASKEGPVAKVFDGSGAGYWQPGHGAFNTTWNLNVLITSGAYSDETVTILGLDEGPGARIVGLHGNRRFKLDYRPTPYIEALNERVAAVPSLYDYQLLLRKQ